MARKVCPKCKTDDRLVSIERASIMYPIVVEGDEFDYTGDDPITLDEGTEFTDELYCRICGLDLTLSDLVDAD